MDISKAFSDYRVYIYSHWILGKCSCAPGTIDGMIYMRPEITIMTHLKVQPEIIIQGLLMSAWISKWMKPKNIA